MISQHKFNGSALGVSNSHVPGRAPASAEGESPILRDNKAMVRRLYEEVWNQRRLDVVDELISPSHALNEPLVSDSQIGPELYKRRVAELTESFPDLRFTIENMLTETSKVVVSWIISGTLPAAGSKIFLAGFTIHHITNGKIFDSRPRCDALRLLRQLAANSPPRPTAVSI
jgi:predicted ester cyclase